MRQATNAFIGLDKKLYITREGLFLKYFNTRNTFLKI
jgi:hypothetical protein